MTSVVDSLQTAVGHHQQGQLQQAESIYRKVLDADPHQVDALHLLGVVHQQCGGLDEAAELITHAISVVPNVAEFHNSLGNVFRDAGKIDDAIASYRMAIQMNLDYSLAKDNLQKTLQVHVSHSAIAGSDGLSPHFDTHDMLLQHDRNTQLIEGQLHEGTVNQSQMLYLDMLKRCLTNVIYDDDTSFTVRYQGRDNQTSAHTMIGMQRLNNLQFCVIDAITRGVPGDVIETGIWRGGAVIFMRAILKVLNVTDRIVWGADSFEGLPRPAADKYEADKDSELFRYEHLAVSLEQVQSNCRRYGLLDDQVRFLKGWFRDTLPAAPVSQLAVLRLDGDMYESTIDALLHLYPKLSVGGYVIVDDYACIDGCRQAVQDFRRQHRINDALVPIDWSGVYWQRTA